MVCTSPLFHSEFLSVCGILYGIHYSHLEFQTDRLTDRQTVFGRFWGCLLPLSSSTLSLLSIHDCRLLVALFWGLVQLLLCTCVFPGRDSPGSWEEFLLSATIYHRITAPSLAHLDAFQSRSFFPAVLAGPAAQRLLTSLAAGFPISFLLYRVLFRRQVTLWYLPPRYDTIIPRTVVFS